MKYNTLQERFDAYDKVIEPHLPKVRDKIEKLGFFTAPCSTKYHLNYEGGLFEHSMNVVEALVKLTNDNHLKWMREESPIIVGILHDLCKSDQYIKTPDGRYAWNQDAVLQGHGIKSVMLASEFVNLTLEEKACIENHMGAFTDKDKWSQYTSAIHMFPNVLWTHTADMIATHIMEV